LQNDGQFFRRVSFLGDRLESPAIVVFRQFDDRAIHVIEATGFAPVELWISVDPFCHPKQQFDDVAAPGWFSSGSLLRLRPVSPNGDHLIPLGRIEQAKWKIGISLLDPQQIVQMGFCAIFEIALFIFVRCSPQVIHEGIHRFMKSRRFRHRHGIGRQPNLIDDVATGFPNLGNLPLNRIGHHRFDLFPLNLQTVKKTLSGRDRDAPGLEEGNHTRRPRFPVVTDDLFFRNRTAFADPLGDSQRPERPPIRSGALRHSFVKRTDAIQSSSRLGRTGVFVPDLNLGTGFVLRVANFGSDATPAIWFRELVTMNARHEIEPMKMMDRTSYILHNPTQTDPNSPKKIWASRVVYSEKHINHCYTIICVRL